MSTDTRGLERHIVVIGWSERIAELLPKLRNFLSEKDKEPKPLLIISPQARSEEISSGERTYFTYGKCTDIEVLKRAHLDKAAAVIIPLSTANDPNEDSQVALAAIVATVVYSEVPIIVEVLSEETRKTLVELKNHGILGTNAEIIHLGEINARAFANSVFSKRIN